MKVKPGFIIMELCTKDDIELFELIIDNAKYYIEESFSERSDDGLDRQLLDKINQIQTGIDYALGRKKREYVKNNQDEGQHRSDS